MKKQNKQNKQINTFTFKSLKVMMLLKLLQNVELLLICICFDFPIWFQLQAVFVGGLQKAYQQNNWTVSGYTVRNLYWSFISYRSWYPWLSWYVKRGMMLWKLCFFYFSHELKFKISWKSEWNKYLRPICLQNYQQQQRMDFDEIESKSNSLKHTVRLSGDSEKVFQRSS